MKTPVQMRQTRAIEQSVVVNADADAVFRALTDAKELVKWWPTSATSEPRAGGRFRYEWRFEKESGRDHAEEGAYLDVVPGRLVRYPWAVRGHAGETIVTFVLSPEARATRVTLMHTGWSEDATFNESLEHHVQGWAGFLANLKVVLEGGRDMRRDMMGLSTIA